jgi:hypothetical protein
MDRNLPGEFCEKWSSTNIIEYITKFSMILYKNKPFYLGMTTNFFGDIYILYFDKFTDEDGIVLKKYFAQIKKDKS